MIDVNQVPTVSGGMVTLLGFSHRTPPALNLPVVKTAEDMIRLTSGDVADLLLRVRQDLIEYSAFKITEIPVSKDADIESFVEPYKNHWKPTPAGQPTLCKFQRNRRRTQATSLLIAWEKYLPKTVFTRPWRGVPHDPRTQPYAANGFRIPGRVRTRYTAP